MGRFQQWFRTEREKVQRLTPRERVDYLPVSHHGRV